MITLPNLQDAPQFDAQAVPDSGDDASLVAGIGGTGIISGGVVSAQGSPNRTVAVSAIDGVINRVPFHAASVSSLSIPSYTTDVKHAVVYDSADSTVKIVAGTACGTAGWSRSVTDKIAHPPPVKPVLASTQVMLFEIYDDGNNVTTGHLKDKRTPVNISSGQFLVAATDSLQIIKFAANYVCDGTADDVEINAAIVAAGSVSPGGKVTLAAGTFTLASRCKMQYNGVEVEGQGAGTIIIIGCALADVATPTASWSGAVTSITVSSGSNIFCGLAVSGANIDVNTVVLAISGTTVTLSKPTLGTQATTTLHFQGYNVYPAFDVYSQHNTGTASVSVDNCYIHDMQVQYTGLTSVAANPAGISGAGGARGQAARTLLSAVYLNGNYNKVKSIKCTGLMEAVLYDIWDRSAALLQTTDTGVSAIIGNLSTTGTWSAGSKAVTLASGTSVAVGQQVVGTGLQGDTTVAAIAGTALTLSKPAIAAGSGTTLTFHGYTLTSATLAAIAQVGDSIRVNGQTATGNYNNTVLGFVTNVNAGTGVITIDEPLITSIASGGTAILTTSQPGMGRATSNWIEDIECVNCWVGAGGAWQENIHIENVRGNFQESVMANFVSTGSTPTSVSAAHGVYATGNYGNEHLNPSYKDIETSSKLLYTSPSAAASVAGTIITGTGFSAALVGAQVMSVAGTGVLYPGTTITAQGGTTLTLSRAASTDGTLTELIVIPLNGGSVAATTLKIGSTVGGNINGLSCRGSAAVMSVDGPLRKIIFSNLRAIRSIAGCIGTATSQGASYTRQCLFNNLYLEFDQCAINPNSLAQMAGYNCEFSNVTIATDWQVTLGGQNCAQIGGRYNVIAGLNFIHRGIAERSVQFVADGGHHVSGIVGNNVTRLIDANSGVNIPYYVSYNPQASVLSGAGPLVSYNSAATGTPVLDKQSSQQLLIQTGGGTITPDISLAATTVISVTDATNFTIGPPAVASSGGVVPGVRHRFIIRNDSGGAMGTVTWNSIYAMPTAFTSPANGVHAVENFESDTVKWRQV